MISGGNQWRLYSKRVSTSFVSRQVVRLEDRLDTRLLHRTTRAVRLTDMGRIYYERSRAILDDLAVLESDMADLQEHPKGRVRITAPGYYAEQFVAPILEQTRNLFHQPDRSPESRERSFVSARDREPSSQYDARLG